MKNILYIITDLLKLAMSRIFTILCIAIFISCASNGTKIIRNDTAGQALGTTYNIIYLADRELDFQTEIDSVFNAINHSLSTYIPDSDISKINGGDSTVVVDDMFHDVFVLSKEINYKTNGYFDPTVGVLVNAWGFGPGGQIKMDSTQVDSLLDFVGFDKVCMTERGTIKKTKPNIYFDFNAVAKGYAIDRLALLFDAKGIEDYLIEVGGELVGKGSNKLKKKPWTVGVDDPQMEEMRKMKLMIGLKNKALASSGNYRHFRVDPVTGKKYVHTVDPITGFTKNSNTLGATILANTCAKADAYATAFMAMDLDDALKSLSKQRELEAYIVYLDEEGNTQEFMTEGFKALVIN